MELLYQGVVTGELSLERWVETCCTTPARMFGMFRARASSPRRRRRHPRLGPDEHTSIGIDTKHHMNMDYSAWEGFEIDGKVDTVLSRGSVVVENDTFVGRKGHGQYIKRGCASI